MSKPSPLEQKFWDVFGELFSSRAADILDPDEDCPFHVLAVVYPGDKKEGCGEFHTKRGIVDVALDLDPSRGDLNKLTG